MLGIMDAVAPLATPPLATTDGPHALASTTLPTTDGPHGPTWSTRRRYATPHQPLPIGTQVDLRFTVLADEIETIEGTGEVVRVVVEGVRPGMGVAFAHLTPQSWQVLHRLTGQVPPT